MIGFSSEACDAAPRRAFSHRGWLEGFGLSEHPQATAAAGAIVHYLRETSAIGARKPEDAAVVRQAPRWDGARTSRPHRRITSSRTRWSSTR